MSLQQQHLRHPLPTNTIGLQEYVALMQECWHQNPSQRPTFEHVVLRLKTLRRAAISRSNLMPTRTSTSSTEAPRISGEVTPSGPSNDALYFSSRMSGAAGGENGGEHALESPMNGGGGALVNGGSHHHAHDAPPPVDGGGFAGSAHEQGALAAEGALPSLQGLAEAPLRGMSSAETDSSGGLRAGAPVKFTLRPDNPERLLSGGVQSMREGDVADALSVVQSTAAAAAAFELALAQQQQGGDGTGGVEEGAVVGAHESATAAAGDDDQPTGGDDDDDQQAAGSAQHAHGRGGSSGGVGSGGRGSSGGSSRVKKSWSKFLSGRT